MTCEQKLLIAQAGIEEIGDMIDMAAIGCVGVIALLILWFIIVKPIR